MTCARDLKSIWIGEGLTILRTNGRHKTYRPDFAYSTAPPPRLTNTARVADATVDYSDSNVDSNLCQVERDYATVQDQSACDLLPEVNIGTRLWIAKEGL